MAAPTEDKPDEGLIKVARKVVSLPVCPITKKLLPLCKFATAPPPKKVTVPSGARYYSIWKQVFSDWPIILWTCTSSVVVGVLALYLRVVCLFLQLSCCSKCSKCLDSSKCYILMFQKCLDSVYPNIPFAGASSQCAKSGTDAGGLDLAQTHVPRVVLPRTKRPLTAMSPSSYQASFLDNSDSDEFNNAPAMLAPTFPKQPGMIEPGMISSKARGGAPAQPECPPPKKIRHDEMDA